MSSSHAYLVLAVVAEDAASELRPIQTHSSRAGSSDPNALRDSEREKGTDDVYTRWGTRWLRG